MSERSGPYIPVARATFWVHIGGRDLLVKAGEAWLADDPVVVAHPDKFEPLRFHTSTEPSDAVADVPAPSVPEPSDPAPSVAASRTPKPRAPRRPSAPRSRRRNAAVTA